MLWSRELGRGEGDSVYVVAVCFRVDSHVALAFAMRAKVQNAWVSRDGKLAENERWWLETLKLSASEG